MADQTVIFGLWAICFIVYVIEGIRRRRRLKEYQQWAALHAPLTAATSRLDGALRYVRLHLLCLASCDVTRAIV
jgi:hypothetical protein